MEHQKNLNLSNERNDSKFVTRKSNIVNHQSNANSSGNEIICSIDVLKYDAYVVVKDDITVSAAPTTQVSFKNYAPFTKCITKIDRTIIDDA